ncbi:hypothetical protein CY34DRAFT_110466 [Suillus luteus UH-Slu-Lm8-n1]|uniref:Uncharacterized protein n=1 Tax=Suillus luteus UH-Slu-Lm8-n1 TaxID=930992 RepID=A0A0D0APU1_9AGAM|nr:hypothetical protein CY34DRAFT_110466 [Suillus luteus UH-Slu-Lm8-n1]
MVGSQWTNKEQKAYLESQFSEFLKQQLQATLTGFWDTVCLEFLKRWHEIDVQYPDKSKHPNLTEAEKELLGEAVTRSHKSGRSSLNIMMKSINKMLGNRAKGTRVHMEVEIFSKMNYDSAVRGQIQEKIDSGLLVTRNEKLLAVRETTKAAYEAAPPEIKSLCKAKAAEERNSKASVILPGPRATERPTNAQYVKALKECIGPVSQFLDAVRQLTGWEWTVIGGGPDPRLGGMLNVVSYHTGINESGLTWKQATPNFTEKHLNPYLGYLATVFSEDDRKQRALDYIPPVVQDGNTSCRDAVPTTSDDSAQSPVPFTLDSAQSQMPFTSTSAVTAGGSSGAAPTGLPIIPQPQLPNGLPYFNLQGPDSEFPSFNNDTYSFSGGNLGIPSKLTLSPVPQMPTLPGGSFSSSSSALPSSHSPITSWNETYWNSMPPLHMAPLSQSDILPYNFNFYSPPSLDSAHESQHHINSNPISFSGTAALNPQEEPHHVDTPQQPALHLTAAPQPNNSTLNLVVTHPIHLDQPVLQTTALHLTAAPQPNNSTLNLVVTHPIHLDQPVLQTTALHLTAAPQPNNSTLNPTLNLVVTHPLHLDQQRPSKKETQIYLNHSIHLNVGR